jgi:hypothetical protein
MNWDAISAVSQMIGSIAVVVSVLYLAVQLRSSTRVAKVAAMDAAAAALRDVTKPFMENAELARIWRTGLENLDALSAEDKARFFHAAHQFLKALETIHYHYVYGLLDLQLWEGWRDLLQHYVATPGIHHYLSLRGAVFSERFRKFIAELEPVTERRTVGNLLGQESRPGLA